MTKLIVVGLDGANWELIDPWIESGYLPNIKKLKENGCFSDHSSCLPPVTYPNWKCYSTGKNPGKLGVFRFDRIDCKKRDFIIHNSTSFKSREIWDYMGENGLKTGIINMPTTYPPKKVNGFLISGGPDTTETSYRAQISGYTYPSELEKYLHEKFNYKIHPSPYLSSKNDGKEEAEAIIKLIKMRFEVGLEFLERGLDFLQITIFYINALQHYFWNNEFVKEAWKTIDDNIGKLLDKSENIILMSDHGCCKIKTVFHINRWLEKEGYLITKKTLDDLFFKLGLSKERALKIAKKFELVDFLNRIVPESLIKKIPREEGVRGERKLDKVNWDKTKAIASNQGPIYLNVDKNSKDYEKVRGELIQKLQSLRSPITGEKIFKKIYKSEEAFSGAFLDDSPDLIIEQVDGVHVSESMGKGKVFSGAGNWEADNKTTGLFLAYGKDIKEGGNIKRINITDIAPTILHMFGVPIPDDMDGEVIKDIFMPQSEPGKRTVEHKKYKEYENITPEISKNEKELIKNRLKDLGYIS